jgi:hypothetical protein
MVAAYELHLSLFDCAACKRQIVTFHVARGEVEPAKELESARAFVKHRFPDALVLAPDAAGDVHCPCGNPISGEAARDADLDTLRVFPPRNAPELSPALDTARPAGDDRADSALPRNRRAEASEGGNLG